MWQTKNSITVILVVVLVTLVVINTVQLEPPKLDQRSSGRNNEKQTTTSPTGGAGRSLDGGQLETFNAESTGLGDLEGADSLKKMLRRSGRSATRGDPELGRLNMADEAAAGNSPVVDAADADEQTGRELMLLAVEALLEKVVAQDYDRKLDQQQQQQTMGLQVSRRATASELATGQPPGQASGDPAPTGGAGSQDEIADDSALSSSSSSGPSSRLSLLTMRKVPEQLASAGAAWAARTASTDGGSGGLGRTSWAPKAARNGWPQEFRPPGFSRLGGPAAPDQLGRGGRQQNEQQWPVLTSIGVQDPNYLPRIARSSSM